MQYPWRAESVSKFPRESESRDRVSEKIGKEPEEMSFTESRFCRYVRGGIMIVNCSRNPQWSVLREFAIFSKRASAREAPV